MRLLIAGKYIQIDEYFELITENPLINNFDTQYAQYSNSITVPYNGEIAKAIDVSLLRKSASPYLLIEGHLIDGVVLLPVKILITNYDPIKNTVTLGVVERITAGVAGGLSVLTTKLTELNYRLYLGVTVPDEFTDLIMLSNGDIDMIPGTSNLYVGDTPVLADSQTYPHPIHPDNNCPIVSLGRLATFLSERYGFSVVGMPSGNVFANRQRANAGDLVIGTFNSTFELDGESPQRIEVNSILEHPAGTDSFGRLTFGDEPKLVTYRNAVGDSDGNFITCRIEVSGTGTIPNETNWTVRFKDVDMDFVELDDRTLVFRVADKSIVAEGYCDTIGFEDNNLLSIYVYCEESISDFLTLTANVRMNVTIADNKEIATPANTRQILKNLPDVTIFDFFKTVAKANAKFVEITSSGVTFKNFADVLTPAAIQDVSEHFIQAMGVEYKLYDAPALEYWYKNAETPTLIVPITDARVAGAAKKIEINMLRTDDENVVLFEDDGVKPLDGIATYPFLNITDHAADLADFYLAIQNPFVVRAKFRKFDVDPSKSLLIRQLNGLFIPKKIIKTNRDIIELELLKLED